MHELSLARAILDAALRHGDGQRVLSVRMRAGRLRQAVPESLRFYFGIVAQGTPAEGAELELEPVDALLRCRECGREWDPAPGPALTEGELMAVPSFRCPGCGAGGEVVRGEELEVESIVIEEKGAQCIAPG